MKTPKKIRFLFFLILSIIAYLVCTFSLFELNGIVLPLVSFIILYIGLSFLAIDLQHHRKHHILRAICGLTILQMIIFGDFDWHIYVEILFFHGAIVLMMYLLFSQLKNRIRFSAISYFTQGSSMAIVAVITMFFSVLIMGKYSQIPFSCDEIEGFPGNLFRSSSNAEKTLENTDDLSLNKPEIKLIFGRTIDFLQTEVFQPQGSINKNSCEFVMNLLQKTQMNGGFQLAVIVLLYFLLSGVFKIILWIISLVGFGIFLTMKPLGIYSFEVVERQVERVK
ncbi:hypothetical protein AGMMS50249_0820 [candidate division SR1 bacterium]|nr:hypothetical protein AGMMS50249_0820 [candidate division SR1 bacterium]